MEIQNDKIDKYVYLCHLYEEMDEKERESLMRVAGKLFEAQLSIGNDRLGLSGETDEAEMA